jgi:hypothetical protein
MHAPAFSVHSTTFRTRDLRSRALFTASADGLSSMGIPSLDIYSWWIGYIVQSRVDKGFPFAMPLTRGAWGVKDFRRPHEVLTIAISVVVVLFKRREVILPTF